MKTILWVVDGESKHSHLGDEEEAKMERETVPRECDGKEEIKGAGNNIGVWV